MAMRATKIQSDKADAIGALRNKIGGSKDVIFAEALPETVGGKVLKYKLRASYAAHYAGHPAAEPPA